MPVFFLYCLALLILLFLSAFFSASETALFSISYLDISRMLEKKERAGTVIYQMLKTPRTLLITILFGNTLVNIFFFSISTVISFSLQEYYGSSALIIGGGLSLSTIILFGEVLPKAIAVKIPLHISRWVCFILMVILKIFAPVIKILDIVTHFFSHLLEADKKEKYITCQELKLLLSWSEKAGVIKTREYDMLLDLLDLQNIKVKEVMIPRVDMVKISLNASPQEVFDLFCKTKVSYITIYDIHEDDVLGIVYAKQFLLGNGSLKSLIRQIPYVSENMNVEALLKFLRKQKQTVAFIVDEYGGLEGLITIENLIEVLVGEIEDEYDRTIPLIVKVAENRYHLSGRLSLKEWQEFFKIEAVEYRCETISGLVTTLLQRIPRKGDKVQYQNLMMEVLEVHRHRISLLSVEIMNAKDQ